MEILNYQMKNKKKVKDNWANLITKLVKKFLLEELIYEFQKISEFSYMHTVVKKNLGKIGVLLSLETSVDKGKLNEFGKQLAMHMAASSIIYRQRWS